MSGITLIKFILSLLFVGFLNAHVKRQSNVERIKGGPNIRTPHNLAPTSALSDAVNSDWNQGKFKKAIQFFPVSYNKRFNGVNDDSEGNVAFQFAPPLEATDEIGSAILYLSIECDDDDYSGTQYEIMVSNPNIGSLKVNVPTCRHDYFVEYDIKSAVIQALQSPDKRANFDVSITPAQKDMPEVELKKSFIVVHTI